MDDLDDLLGELPAVADAPTLLVACAFDGALAPEGTDRTEQQSSEAINTLTALQSTRVAVLSDLPPDEAAELMFLSGAKGGARITAPADLAALRAELGSAVLLVVDTGSVSLEADGPGDLAVRVGGEHPRAWSVDDSGDVVEILEELVALRRRHRAVV
jgi:hypothetical protein